MKQKKLQYINKNDVLEEISRVLNSYHPTEITSGRYALADLREFINSMEVKEHKWSEEDEKMLSDTIGAVWAADYYIYEDKQDIEIWLKSLKQRIVL